MSATPFFILTDSACLHIVSDMPEHPFVSFRPTAKAISSAVAKGLTDVTPAQITAGFEFEFISPLSHSDFAEVFAAENPEWRVGEVDDEYASHKHRNVPLCERYTEWHVTSDSSIGYDEDAEDDCEFEDQYPGKYPIELVSPPAPSVEAAVEMLEKTFLFLGRHDCKTDKSCGLHVTFGHPKVYAKESGLFDSLRFAWLIDEEKFLRAFRREGNEFCRPYYRYVLNNIRTELGYTDDRCFQVDLAKRAVWQSSDGACDEVSANFQGFRPASRSRTVAKKITRSNFRDVFGQDGAYSRFLHIDHHSNIALNKIIQNLVEVRGMGGNYIRRSPKTVGRHVRHVANCLSLALNPTAFREEFLKDVAREVGVP